MKDFVGKIDVSGKVDGKSIMRGSELGAWVQIFLISQEYDTNNVDRRYLGIDGKLGRFTHKALSAYKGDKETLGQARKNTKEQIDRENLQRVNEWLQGAREFSSKWKNPIEVKIVNESEPFKIAVKNYGQETIIDLNTGKMTFDGETFDAFTTFQLEKVNGKINIEASSKNPGLLSLLYRQASLLNRTFGNIVRKKMRSDEPFYVFMGALLVDDGRFNDMDILEDINEALGVYSTSLNAALGKVKKRSSVRSRGYDHLTGVLNRIYKKRVVTGKIK